LFGDAECPEAKGSKGAGSGRSSAAPKRNPKHDSYFVARDTDDDGEAEAMVVHRSNAHRAGPEDSMMGTPCSHIRERASVVTRGGNGRRRYITCRTCDEHLVSVVATPEKNWTYMVMQLFFTKRGD
jgi:hypothetical protein